MSPITVGLVHKLSTSIITNTLFQWEVETICAKVIQFQVETICSGARPAKILPTKDQLSVRNINIVYSDSDTFTTSHTLQSDTRRRYNFLVVKAEHSNGR